MSNGFEHFQNGELPPGGISGSISSGAFENFQNGELLSVFTVAFLTGEDPTGLVASEIDYNQIDLVWNDNSSNEDGFSIERSADGVSGWTEIDTVATNVEAYSDTGLSEHTTYYYRVRAIRGIEYSEYTNVANATTIIRAPTSLVATTFDDDRIDLVWTDNSSVEDGFKIEISLTGVGGWTEIDTVGAGVTTYSDTGLDPSTTYYYRVRAYDGGDDSEYSNVDSATTDAVMDIRVTAAGAYAEIEQTSLVVTQAGALAEISTEGLDVTQFGVLVEIGNDTLTVTHFGVLVEIEYAPPMPTYFPPKIEWQHHYYALPEPVTGYALDQGGSFWNVVIPRESKNLISTPSFQRIPDSGFLFFSGWSTYEISPERGSRGPHSLKLTPSAGVLGKVDGIFYPETTGPHTWGLDLYMQAGQAVELRIQDATDLDPIFLTVRIVANTTGWTRYNVVYVEPGPIVDNSNIALITQRYATLRFTTDNTDVTPIYTDGWVVAAGKEEEIYFDGDNKDNSYNVDPYVYAWSGVPHLSTSIRGPRTMSGGYIRSFYDLGFKTTGIMGLGMGDSDPDIVTMADGEEILRGNIAGGKEFSILGSLIGCNPYELQKRRQGLINFFNRLNSTSGGVTLLYQAVNGSGVPIGKRLRIESAFISGLSMSFDNNFQENMELRFRLLSGKVVDEFGETAELEMGYEPDPETLFYSQNLRTGEWYGFGNEGETTIGGTIDCVLVMDAGYVVVGGSFTSIGGISSPHIAIWNPFTRHWQGAGGGLDGDVTGLAEGKGAWAGEVIAIGSFENSFDEFANVVRRIGRYDRITNLWTEIDQGLTAAPHALATHPSGRIYIVGPNMLDYALNFRNKFIYADGRTGGDGLLHAIVDTMTGEPTKVIIGPDLKVYLGGTFTEIDAVSGYNRVAVYDPTYAATPLLAFDNLNQGLDNNVNDLVFGPDGALYAVGIFTTDTASGSNVRSFAKWTGAIWQEVGNNEIDQDFHRIVVDKRGNFYIAMTPYDDKSDPDAFSETGFYGWNGSSWFSPDLRNFISELTQPQDAMLMASDGRWYTSVRAGSITNLSGYTLVNNTGTADAQVKLQIVGPCVVHRFSNWTAGKHVYFRGFQLAADEQFTLDLTGFLPRAYSTDRPDMLNMLLAGVSNLTDFRLLPGFNHITLLTSGTYGATTHAVLSWNNTYWSIDSGLVGLSNDN